jgi:hypothetical protein
VKLGSYSISSRPISGVCKRAAIWGHEQDTGTTFPLAYLQRPKWVTDEAWEKILHAINLEFQKGTEL